MGSLVQKYVVSTRLLLKAQLLLIMLIIVWLTGCSKAANPVIALEGDNASRVSYLFYNQDGPSRSLSLHFHTAYNDQVDKVVFMQDETVVTTSAIPVSTSNNNGQFSIMLTMPYYIEQFNVVRLLNERDEIVAELHTGQYYFDAINISAPTGETTWQLRTYEGKEYVNKASLDATFTKSGHESFEYEIVLPSRLAQQQIVQQTDKTSIEDNTFDYHYESFIAPEDFHHYNEIAYEMIVVQKDKRGYAASLVHNTVQLSRR
ncbi:hypothetical protein H8B09_22880 [Paenibacillus sp. PR3]|uniref:Lipoprotein n=1 Tax=Paenibacillus terricola TaxID=2763503 RepID=A0ABR8N0A8_9BACL|nr:hypothetical protein [Paenibacillus terricola]MBD3921632.1 hypothetical protein [Paenibacillus terricola]